MLIVLLGDSEASGRVLPQSQDTCYRPARCFAIPQHDNQHNNPDNCSLLTDNCSLLTDN